MLSAGAELVGIVPGADVTGLDPDDDIGTAEGRHIRCGFFRSFIPGYDAQRSLEHPLLDKARLSPDLDRAQWRVRLGHQDGRSAVPAQVPGLDVLLLDPDVETAIPPLVVDRGEQDSAIRSQGCEHRYQRPVQQIPQSSTVRFVRTDGP